MSITQSMIDICLDHAGGRRVLAVVVEIGGLSGVVPEAVEFCFAACAAETAVEGASLRIVRIDPAAICRECGQEGPVRSYFDPCSACGGHRLEIIRGEELRVKELEVE